MNKALIFIFLASLIVIAGCNVYPDSVPPGCKKYFFPRATGCFATNKIIDLNVEPKISCLDIYANNCIGPFLTIKNSCSDAFVVYEDVSIQPDSAVRFDIVSRPNGKFTLAEPPANGTVAIPAENQDIEIYGSLGAEQVKISLTRTKAFC